MPSNAPNYRELGQQRLTVDSTAGGVSLTVPAGAQWALMRAKGTAGDGICFTSNGTAPTTSVGMELVVGETMWYDSSLAGFKAIRRDSNNVTLVVSYYTSA